MGLAESFHRQGVKEMIKSSKNKAETQECQQEERKKPMHSLYYRLIFHGNEIVDCAKLR